MSSRIHVNRIYQVFYPLAVYFLSYNLFAVFFKSIIGQSVSDLFCILLAAIITLIIEFFIYRKLPIALNYHEDIAAWQLILYIALIVLCGILLNVAVTNLPLESISSNYARANDTLYSGSILVKILSNCIFIPILEEVVFRGIVCGQILSWHGRIPAMLISSLLFGIMHFNVIQFLYAFLMGLLLSFVYCKTHRLWILMIAHGLTNFVVVLYASYFM